MAQTNQAQTEAITLVTYLEAAALTYKDLLGETEAQIKDIFKNMYDDIMTFVNGEYNKYEDVNELTFDYLAQKGRYTDFINEVTNIANSHLPLINGGIIDICNQAYVNGYGGVADGAKKSKLSIDLGKILTVAAVARIIQNPISGLTLNDKIQKMSQDILYSIKQGVSMGITSGDTSSTMSKRIKTLISGDNGTNGIYGKTINVARNESSRTNQAGIIDAATDLEQKVQDKNLPYGVFKTWKTMEDERVRPQRGIKGKKGKIGSTKVKISSSAKANHMVMDGITIPASEKFDLGSGVTTDAPRQSGDPSNDINCRCTLLVSIGSTSEQSSQQIEQDLKTLRNNHVSVKKMSRR